jgi:ATP-binding cassette subfamily B protein
LLQGIIPVGVAWIIKQIFDLLAQGLPSRIELIPWQSLSRLLLGYVLLRIFSQMFQAINKYLNSELNRQLVLNVRLTLNSKINSLVGLAPFENPHLYNSIQLALAGAQIGPQQIISMLTSFVQNFIMLFGFLGVLLAFDPFLAAMVSLAALPQLFVQLKFGQQRFSLAMIDSPKERQLNYYNYVLSGLGFAKELRLFELAAYFMQAMRLTNKDIHRAQRRQELYEMRWQLILNFFSSTAYGGAFIFVILCAFAGIISLGTVTLYISAVSNIQNALLGIFYAISTLIENAMFYSQFKTLLALPQPMPVADPPHAMIPLSSRIELINVSFRYSDQHQWVLHNFNLTISVGQCLALVGLNGAGKSTLVKLL